MIPRFYRGIFLFKILLLKIYGKNSIGRLTKNLLLWPK